MDAFYIEDNLRNHKNKINCFYAILAQHKTLSSSVYKNDIESYGPEYAIDGFYSDDNRYLFTSKVEDYPWLQWKLAKPVFVSGIVLCLGGYVGDIEIRAGNVSMAPGFKGKLSANIICGRFAGPGEVGEDYTIVCDEPILADYVTIQILDDMATLQINELRIISKFQGTITYLNFSSCLWYTFI